MLTSNLGDTADDRPRTGGSRTRRMAALTRAGATVIAVVLASPSADAALSKHGDAEASFEASGTGGLRIQGKTSELRVDDATSQVTIVVPLAGLDTGIALRNRHMREKYLEVEKYPNASLRVDRSALQFPRDGSTISHTLSGQLSMHGQTRPATFAYTATREGQTYRVAGAMRVDMTQYGIKAPSFMGIRVNPEVSVRVRFQAQDK